jgi:hypothetical protein
MAKSNLGAVHEALAMAHAELGQFDEAVKWQKKAVGNPKYMHTGVEERLKFYEMKQPFRGTGPTLRID